MNHDLISINIIFSILHLCFSHKDEGILFFIGTKKFLFNQDKHFFLHTEMKTL